MPEVYQRRKTVVKQILWDCFVVIDAVTGNCLITPALSPFMVQWQLRGNCWDMLEFCSDFELE